MEPTTLEPAAPAADASPGLRLMPGSVAALIFFSTIGGLATVFMQASIITGLIGIGLAIGVYRRSLWCRNMLILFCALDLLMTLLAVAEPYLRAALGADPDPLFERGSPLAALFYLVLLNRESARRWFGLQCPRCDAFAGRPTSWFGRARAQRSCRACDHAWDTRQGAEAIADALD